MQPLADRAEISVEISPDIPFSELLLRWTLFHEIAHSLSFNQLAGWAWHCSNFPAPEDILPARRPQRPGRCRAQWPGAPGSEIWTLLQQSPYPTPYSICSPEEHFAEIFAAYAMRQAHDFDIKISAKGAQIYHLAAHLDAPVMAQARRLAGAFLRVQSQAELDQAVFDHMICAGAFAP